MFKLLVLLLITLSAVSPAAVGRSSTIDNPCQVDATSTGTPKYLPIKEQIELTITAANTTYTMCQRFKEALRTVLTLNETNQLDSPIHNIPGLSLACNDSALSAANVLGAFEDDYQDISAYIVYLQFLQNLQAKDNGKFAENNHLVSNQFYSWRCSVNTIMRSNNLSVTQIVNSAVDKQLESYAAKDSKNRYSLYYVLMKNAQDFAKNKTLKWATYLQTL
ncbi:unnamed protein product [Candidula unifasciata]|uniref:Uncharacterized protein n=1 Tax=Candidula unifasciata TaxID=100452 RepID=A0A8S3ZRN6_9EUPU|nr:unnamed protein product [Candidula unifasciata]